MPTTVQLALLVLSELLLGFGIICRLRPGQPLPALLRTQWGLALLAGVPTSTLLLFLQQLAGFGLAFIPFVVAGIVIGIGLLWPALRTRRGRPARQALPLDVARAPHPASLVILGIVVVAVLIGVWRCYYLPVRSRDGIVGFDLVAKYAVEQGSFQSSVFTDPHLQGSLSNQPFYAPFAALAQILYRLTGLAFGKLWLSLLVIAFAQTLHRHFIRRQHPAIAAYLVLAFFAVPEMYGHTFNAAPDLPNAIFWAAGMLVLSEWYEARATRAGASDSGGPPPSVPAPRRFDLVLAGSFFGWACWTRSETVFLVVIGVLALQVAALLSRRKLGVSGVAALLVPSLLLFATWNLVYCPLVLNYDPGAQVGYQLPTPDRIRDTLTKLLWLLQSQTLYGPILFVFGVGVAANFARARGQGGTLHLTGFILVVCCYAVLLLFVPSATAEHTAKRGFFKLIPLALLYLGECRLLTDLSARLTRWERGTAL